MSKQFIRSGVGKGVSVFDEFTNLYSLSKTLRFELKPVGNTKQMLADNRVFKKDETIQKKYEQTKPYFDQLHREFVQDALADATLSGLTEYFELYKKWKNDKKLYEKELQKKEAEIRKEVVAIFNKKAKEWANTYAHFGVKKKDTELFFEENVFKILEARYKGQEGTELPNEKGQMVSIFESWKGFTGYFTKFFETRRNFYKADGTSTALATRIVDQNLRRFCDNILTYEKISKLNLSEIKDNFGIVLSELFTIEYYFNCLLQSDIDFYNAILGGDSKDQNKKGINQYINLHRQKTGEKLPYLKALDKQILSEKDKFIDEIENEKELLEILHQMQETANKKIAVLTKLFDDFVHSNTSYDLSQVYISKVAFNSVSNRWTNETKVWEDNLFLVLKEAKIVSNSTKKKEGGYSFPEFISLYHVKKSLEKIPQDISFCKSRYYSDESDVQFSVKGVLHSDDSIWFNFLQILRLELSNLLEKNVFDNGVEKKVGYNVSDKELKDVLTDFKLNPDSKVKIKNFADDVLHIYQLAKYFALEKKGKWVGEEYDLGDFYEHPEFGYNHFYENAYVEIVQVYNKLRNFVTKKPYSEEKWKLNFENARLLSGWSDSPNGNTQYCSFIFRKNNQYFLGVTDYPKLFDYEKFPEAYDTDGDSYEKMVYKQIDAKTLYGPVYKGLFGSKYSEDKEKLSDKELIQRIRKVLELKLKDFSEFKHIINKIDIEKYENAKELAREISTGAFYHIFFKPVSHAYVTKGLYEIKTRRGDTKNKKLYIFQIKNKDWNEGSTGSKNLHTLYFEGLFSEDNIAQNFPLKLNGQAEIFYRPKTQELNKEKIITQKNNIHLEKGDKAFKKNRYTEDKIFFHLPLTLNRTAGEARLFNYTINNYLANNHDINIIGVDRGEKHLAYYSVITQKGQIIDCGSLNFVGIDGSGKVIDYHKKLEEKAKDREQSRKDWQDIQGIKDLKKGYVSQVVRKLADLAIEHNAIIVFEDLNMRFKQIRGGIEKSVYQQLEKALIEKLNFLVNKGEKDPNEAGHLLKAYQLTAPFETFKDMGKQTGIIFYTQAEYTSTTDPVTGFRKNVYINNTASIEKIRQEIQKFDEIGWDKEHESYFITYDVKNFSKQKDYPSKSWTIFANVRRIRKENEKGYWTYKSVNPNAMLQELFDVCGITKDRSILDQIKKKDSNGELRQKEFDGKKRDFYKSFVYILNLILQVRNSFSEKDSDGNETYTDFIASPVQPLFTTSSKYSDANTIGFEQKFLRYNGDKDRVLQEFNGDANGAFNIARKGALILQKISAWQDENQKLYKEGKKEKFYPDIFVSQKEWDKFSQK